jgi:hypothetical protein
MNDKLRRIRARARALAIAAAATITLLLLARPGPASAQDTHYWTQQFGNGMLLGGVGVARSIDLSCIYYNPGALSLISGEAKLAGTESFERLSMSIEDRRGKLDLSDSDLGRAPGFVAGSTGQSGESAGSRLAYFTLKRHDFDFNVQEARAGTLIGAIDDLGGEVFIDQQLTDRWFGVTWSRRLNPKTGLGITSVLARRSQGRRSQGILEGVDSGGQGGAALLVDNFDFTHYRLLWKVGLAYDNSPLSLGVALTTPSIGLFGDADSDLNRSIIGLDVDGDGQDDSQLAADTLDEVDSDFESPVSVALGAAYSFARTTVHVAAEWYAKVDRFDVIDPQVYTSQSSGESLAHELTHELDSVINIGGAVEHRVSDRVSAYGSFTTDFTGEVPTSQRDVSFSNWDLYHITGGSVVQIGRSAITLGLGYSFGSENQREALLLDAGARNQLLGLLEDGGSEGAEISFTRWRLILGWSLI